MRPVNGIDLSLTATGIARIRGGLTDAFTIPSKGKKDDDLPTRAARLFDLENRISQCLDTDAFYVIERPAFSSLGGSHHDRSGLWWLLVSKLIHGRRLIEVSPTSVKKYATGIGNASKMQVMAAAIKRYPEVTIPDDNAADALILAAMGARLLGEPIEEALRPSTSLP